MKKAEFISDINSESDVPNEDLKKSRKDRAKKIRSSSDDATDDDEGIQLPSFPMIPQIKTTYNKSNNKYNNKLNQQSNTTGKQKSRFFYNFLPNNFYNFILWLKYRKHYNYPA